MGSSGKGRTVLEVGADGVALITIINPPVNSLSVDVLYSLKDSYEEALRRNDVKAIVITGAKGKFSGGFDISAFGGHQGGQKQEQKPGFISVEVITDIFEGARKPSVAAIDGLALGGGLEVAMACHARISTPTAQLGLPELQLGLIPGFGGTQRLPRLVGISKALEMMLTSKPVKGEEAHDLGLVDAIVSPDQLVSTARKWVLDILERRRPWVASLHKTDKLEPLGEAREILKFARAQVRKQAPNLKHPLVCIDVVEEGIASGGRSGLWKEAESFQGLLQSDTCKSLVHVFFAQRGTSKVPGVTDRGLMPRRVTKVAVIGGGLMGSGIATALILSGYPVVLKEVNDKFLQAGIGRVRANLQSRVKKGKMTQEKFEKTVSLLKGVLDYENFRDVDMVIEAVIEKVSLKQQIFADLEKYCPQHCILASNTSTIDLNLIGEKTKSHDRIIGAHFFSPAHVMPLLEIVRTNQTSPQAIVDLLEVGKRIKKTPVVVGNCTGFAVNRVFFPYTQAALLLVERGADVYQIDRVITKFGMPMGPFRLVDLVGFGVAIATGMQFVVNFPERTYKSMLIPLMQEDGRAGETTRKGFYTYDDRRKATPDTELKGYIEKSRSISGVSIDPKLLKLSEQDIVEMIFFPVVNEACRVLAEGIAVKAADLDIAAIMGMGFPPYRGGLLFWADLLGSKYIYSRLEEWSNTYGEFFKPCAYLAERAANRAPLGSNDSFLRKEKDQTYLPITERFDLGKQILKDMNAVADQDQDMGDGMQCSDHPYRSNPGGICAFCLQDKLGKLVSSASPLPIHASATSSSSSPPFRSDIINGGNGAAAGPSNLSVHPTSSSSAKPRSIGSNSRHDDEFYNTRRARISFLLAKKKKKVSNGAATTGNGGATVASSNREAANMVFNRSKSTTTSRRGHHFLYGSEDFSPRKRGGFWSFLYHSSTKNSSHALNKKAMEKSSFRDNSNSKISSSSSFTSAQKDTKCLGSSSLRNKSEHMAVDADDDSNSSQATAASASSFERKVSRSRSVGCGSRSFSGDFFERISTGFGDCTLRRVESQREGKPKAVHRGGEHNHHNNHCMKEKMSHAHMFDWGLEEL
ncbi:unnamed protein product [Malus baccata var. baccata]